MSSGPSATTTTSTWSCPSGPRRRRRAPPASTLLGSLGLHDFRGYADLELDFGPGPQLVHGANAAGKTSLLEAVVLAAWGRSHRTSNDAELIRWERPLARVEARVVEPAAGSNSAGSALDGTTLEVALVREGSGARKRIRVNGVPRRATALAGLQRTVLFAPEEMLLVVGSPSLRRGTLDTLAGQRSPAYLHDLAAYTKTLRQRNGLLRAIAEERAGRDELRFWDAAFLEAGTALVEARHRLLDELATPLARAHAEIAPDEAEAGRLGLRYLSNAAPADGESVREALERRLRETADKEVWNGTTLVGPHRDDLAFLMSDRDLSSFASRGQQRTAILALKLAELDLLTSVDGRPPLLLLDDVFSELDPERRSHLVRRIAELPQAFVTTTTLEDLDPVLRGAGTAWRVGTGPDGSACVESGGHGEAPGVGR